jgi:hypothetical protein
MWVSTIAAVLGIFRFSRVCVIWMRIGNVTLLSALTISTALGQLVPDRLFIEPTVALSSTGGISRGDSSMNMSLAREFAKQKECTLILSGSPSVDLRTYFLAYEGDFQFTLKLAGYPVSVFKVWPMTAGRVVKKVCEVTDEQSSKNRMQIIKDIVSKKAQTAKEDELSCHTLHESTIDKKSVDLTVRETDQMAACKHEGLYR